MLKRQNIQPVIFLLVALFLSAPALLAQKNNKKKKKPEETTTTSTILTEKEVESIGLYYDATTEKILGNKKEALILYIKCTDKDPLNAAAYYEAATLYNELKQPEAAMMYIKKAVDLDGKNKWYLTLYSDVLLENNKVKEASKVMDQLIKTEPGNEDYLLQKADILIYLKDYKGAITIYDQLEKKLGVIDEIVLQKQKLYLAQGKYDAAEKEMNKLIEAYPNNSEYYGMFAEFYLTINKKDKALKMFDKVVELDPANPIIHLALAKYYQEINEPAKALEYIKIAFKNPDVDIDNKIKIMLSYYELSANHPTRKTEAEDLLKILTDLYPEQPKVWSMKGDFDYRDGKIKEAITDFEKVLEYEQGKYPVWDQLIKMLLDEGAYQKAADQSAKAIELFPNMPQFYYYNGLGNFETGNYIKALESYKTGKDLVISDANQKALFITGIAECYEQLKKYSEAEAAYENGLLTYGNHVLLLTSYANFLSNRGNNLAKAKELIIKAQKAEPKSYEILDVYAWVEYKMGNFKEAKNVMETALQYGGDQYAKVLEHYGDILFKNGDVAMAIQQWSAAKNAKGNHSDQLDTKIQQQKLVE